MEAMEALQIHAHSTEPPNRPKLHSSIPYLDRLKSRLARIPTTPSVILVRSLTSRSESAESVSNITPSRTPTEPAESLSTITPSTTATELPSEIVTAATSVESLHQVFVVQKFHVSPSMPIDEKIKLVWARQIKSRLTAVLLHSIPTGTCVQEFMMAGKKANALKPTLVITCGDAQTKREVEKSFKNQPWLQDVLKANGIMFVALVAKTTLSAGLATNPTSTVRLDDCYQVQLAEDTATTSCGRALLVNASETRPQRQCTLGGLLMVDGEIFGLTAGHPFKSQSVRNPAQHEHELVQPEHEDSSDTSSEPFIFNDDGDDDDDDDAGDLSDISSTSVHSLENLSATCIGDVANGQDDISKSPSVPVKWSQPYSAIIPLSIAQNPVSPEEASRDYDWALLEMAPHSMITIPNRIIHGDSQHNILVETTISGLAQGEVILTVAHAGIQLGYLHSSPATMKVDESILNVQLITLEYVLPLGSSGAWVILGERLCGFIVAIRQDIPWAYMMPIEFVLEDIKQKLGTNDVRLPKRGEIESLVKPVDTENIYEVEEEGSEPFSNRRPFRKPFAVSNTVTTRSKQGASKRDSSQQEDEILNEKSSGPDNTGETLNEKSSGPDNTGETSMTIEFDPEHVDIIKAVRKASNRRRSVSHAVTREDMPGLGVTGSIQPAPAYYIPRRIGRGSSSGFRYLIWKAYAALYMLWRRFEAGLLRMEYRRSRLMRGRIAGILRLPNHPGASESSNLQLAMLISVHYVTLVFCIFWNVIISFFYFTFSLLYFTACFPCHFYVRYRHREVLLDEETLRQQMYESLAMLGPIHNDPNTARVAA